MSSVSFLSTWHCIVFSVFSAIFFFMGFSENVESLSGFSKKLLVFKVLQILSKAETEKIKSKISEVL